MTGRRLPILGAPAALGTFGAALVWLWRATSAAAERALSTGPVANGPAPGDHRTTIVAALWCFGSLIAIGVAWAVLRAVRNNRLARREEIGIPPREPADARRERRQEGPDRP